MRSESLRNAAAPFVSESSAGLALISVFTELAKTAVGHLLYSGLLLHLLAFQPRDGFPHMNFALVHGAMS